jgi:hypothetical protein
MGGAVELLLTSAQLRLLYVLAPGNVDIQRTGPGEF